VVLPLGNLILLLNAVFILGFFPLLVSLFTRNVTAFMKTIPHLYTYLLIIAIPFVLFLHFFALPIIILAFGQEYVAAEGLLRIMAFTGLFALLTSISNNILVAMAKPQITSRNMIVASILNVVLNLLLIPLYGVIGAAVATFISFFCATLFSLYSLRTQGIVFPVSILARILVAGVALYAGLAVVLTLVPTRSIGVSAVIAVSAGIVYGALLIGMKVLSTSDVQFFKKLL